MLGKPRVPRLLLCPGGAHGWFAPAPFAQLQAQRLKCWRQQNAVSFQPVSKTPFRGENGPVKFYFPLQNHLPRSQELRPGEIKYPIILLGTEGRGGEGGTLTKPSPRSPVLSTECLEPGEASEPAVTSARDSGQLTARVRGRPVSTQHGLLSPPPRPPPRSCGSSVCLPHAVGT